MKFSSPKSTRTYRVAIPKGRASYYLMFYPGRGKNERMLSLDTTSLPEAKKRARLKFDAEMDGRLDALQQTAARQTAPTLETIFELYRTHSTTADPSDAILALARMVEITLGITRDQVLEQRVTILTEQLVDDFLAAGRAAAKRDGRVYRPFGANSRLASAKSLFANPRIFRHLAMPDLNGFRHAKGERKAGVDLGFRPFAAGEIEAMDAAAAEARAEHPMIWRAYMLFRHFGLRPIEAAHVRGSWFEPLAGRIHLAIRDRPEEGFTIKNSVPHFIAVPEHLLEVFGGVAKDEFLIAPATTPGQREKWLKRDFSQWVRRWVPDRLKSTYELRKHAGSEVYSRAGVEAARYFLGHTDIQTTTKWYAAWLKSVDAAGPTAPAAPDPLVVAAHGLLAAIAEGGDIPTAAATLRAILPPPEKRPHSTSALAEQ